MTLRRLNQQRTISPVVKPPLPPLAIHILETLQTDNRRLASLYSYLLNENTKQKEKRSKALKRREDIVNTYMERKKDLMQQIDHVKARLSAKEDR